MDFALPPDLNWIASGYEGFSELSGPFEFAQGANGGTYGRLTLQPHHLHAVGICHGGVLMTMADMVMGVCCNAGFSGQASVTIQLESQFVASATAGETLLGRAMATRRTKSLVFLKCALWTGEQHVYAGSGIWKIIRRPPKGS